MVQRGSISRKLNIIDMASLSKFIWHAVQPFGLGRQIAVLPMLCGLGLLNHARIRGGIGSVNIGCALAHPGYNSLIPMGVVGNNVRYYRILRDLDAELFTTMPRSKNYYTNNVFKTHKEVWNDNDHRYLTVTALRGKRGRVGPNIIFGPIPFRVPTVGLGPSPEGNTVVPSLPSLNEGVIETVKPQHIISYNSQFLDWFVGFSEGDGSFIVSTDKKPLFIITQKDSKILEKIRTALGFGRVAKRKDGNFQYVVSNKEHNLKLIEIFKERIVLHKVFKRFMA